MRSRGRSRPAEDALRPPHTPRALFRGAESQAAAHFVRRQPSYTDLFERLGIAPGALQNGMDDFSEKIVDLCSGAPDEACGIGCRMQVAHRNSEGFVLREP